MKDETLGDHQERLLAERLEAERHAPGQWEDEPAKVSVKPSGSEVVSVRLPSSDLDRLEDAAATHGETISQFVRNAIALRLEGRAGSAIAPSLDRVVTNARSTTVRHLYSSSWVEPDASSFAVPDYAPFTVQGSFSTNDESPYLPPAPRSSVFISHSSKDEAVVRWLQAQVEAAGHQPWIAEWDYHPGTALTAKVQTALHDCDAYVLLLTENGYDSVYVQQEVGAAVASGKPVIALVDQNLSDKPMGMLGDIEQVRFDRGDLAASTAAITTGLVHLGTQRGVPVPPSSIVRPTPPALLRMSLQMEAQFQITPAQILIGVCALMAIGGLLYVASKENELSGTTTGDVT